MKYSKNTIQEERKVIICWRQGLWGLEPRIKKGPGVLDQDWILDFSEVFLLLFPPLCLIRVGCVAQKPRGRRVVSLRRRRRSESGVINFIAERLDYLELYSKVTVHRKNTKLITAGTSFHFSFSPLPLH